MTAANQTPAGYAWEYAIADAFRRNASSKVTLQTGVKMKKARQYFAGFDSRQRASLAESADAAVTYILRREHASADSLTHVALAADSDGRNGSVADIIGYAVGKTLKVSAKHHHEDYKHPRFSRTNPIERWGLQTPSDYPADRYTSAVGPVFDALVRSGEKGRRWRDIKNRHEQFIYPVMDAFRAEVESLADHPVAVQGLYRYFVGDEDFYKVVLPSGADYVTVEAFNMHGSLCAPRIPQPSRLTFVSFNEQRNLLLGFDNGASFSLRGHNGEGIIGKSPSVKVAVTPVGVPNTMLVSQLHVAPPPASENLRLL